MNEKYIFMAEDNPNDTILMVRALKKCHIKNRLVVVSDGKQAIAHLFSPEMQDNPAVVILDLKLPFIDGLEILRRIRADENTSLIPVIIFSASIDEKDRQKCLLMGASDFQCKPINFEEFVKLVYHVGKQWL